MNLQQAIKIAEEWPDTSNGVSEERLALQVLYNKYKQDIKDECEKDQKIKQFASRVLDQKIIDGDTWYVPCSVHIAEILVEKIEELKKKNDFCKHVLRSLINLDGFIDQIGEQIDEVLAN